MGKPETTLEIPLEISDVSGQKGLLCGQCAYRQHGG